MHVTKGTTRGISFRHNDDFSGEVHIVISDEALWKLKSSETVSHVEETFGHPGEWVMRLPFEDVRHLVAMYVFQERVNRIENLENDEEILGLRL